MTTSPGTGTAVVTLQGDTTILITRDFAAPKSALWRAYTDPELVRRWWAGEKGEVTLVESDFRVGGTWRQMMTAGPGFEVGFHGEFREIAELEKIVCTETFEGMPDAYSVNTVTFTGEGDTSTLSMLIEHTEAAHRDAHIGSGMEEGMQGSMDALERVAISLR
ncbi:SRPBCC family protein [Kineosporia sp. J2-2]|uniref:SRPBCC family protein n=1 Tax=Kineosporia corallincola TaxID=2835133 RepID=A0ABS5TBR3_9ACTN|nr:SRPBCC family protein [Kineosporia corallincola]MBT0767563.1 SRPBCC family protein [Kineosporia corallincola]